MAKRQAPQTPSTNNHAMQEPGLAGRHRTEKGRIQQKRSDTKNENLPEPIAEFRADATLGTMREKTAQTSVDDVREAARDRK